MSLRVLVLSQHSLDGLLGVIVMGLLYNDMCREKNSILERFGDNSQREGRLASHRLGDAFCLPLR